MGEGLPTNLMVIIIAAMLFIFGVAGIILTRVLLAAF